MHTKDHMNNSINQYPPPRSVIGALLILALAACSEPAVSPVPLAKVAWFIAEPATAEGISFTGVVHARTESNLGFRVAGKIVERLTDPGDVVHKGQPLMRLDSTDYVLASDAAHAAVTAAQARQTQAIAEEVRVRELLAAGAVSAQAYEQAKAAADTALAQTAEAQARARQADHQSDYAVLLADMDGVVMEVPVEPGQVVSAGDPVVKLASKGPREALVYIPENSLALAKHHATATLYSKVGGHFTATLRELSAVADPQTRTYLARYILEGDAASAPLGATVTIELDGPSTSQISIPVSALVDQHDDQGSGIWVIDMENSTVSFRPVEIALLGEEQAHLAHGLEPGERAVAFGGHLLKSGQKVELLAASKQEF
jgi:RND family efflux transporter MFP subunit